MIRSDQDDPFRAAGLCDAAEIPDNQAGCQQMMSHNSAADLLPFQVGHRSTHYNVAIDEAFGIAFSVLADGLGHCRLYRAVNMQDIVLDDISIAWRRGAGSRAEVAAKEEQTG
jgi:hypothetical protein